MRQSLRYNSRIPWWIEHNSFSITIKKAPSSFDIKIYLCMEGTKFTADTGRGDLRGASWLNHN